MKCDDCLNLLEAYVDGEVNDREVEQLSTHLATCANCAAELELLTAEGEMYARYDRELEITPALWNGIAARLAVEDTEIKREPEFNLGRSFAGWLAGLFAVPSLRFAMPVAAMVLLALIAGVVYWQMRPQPQQPVRVAENNQAPIPKVTVDKAPVSTGPETPGSTGAVDVAGITSPGRGEDSRTQIKYSANDKPRGPKPANADSTDIVTSEDDSIAARDTASHLEQAQNLLVSIRNMQLADDDQDVDVSYEKNESRRLLNENIMLRREAENTGKFPAKAMLGSLEPFLIDIANLPDKAKPSEVRQITDRVQRTEIVAELRAY